MTTYIYPVHLEFDADVSPYYLKHDRPGSVGGDLADVRWTNIEWANEARTRIRMVDAELETHLEDLLPDEAVCMAVQIVKEFVHSCGWEAL